jgi:hypothetical protein
MVGAKSDRPIYIIFGGIKMTKNFYDLLVGISVAINGLANTIGVYLLSTGKIDAKTAGLIADTTVAVTGIALGICARFIKDNSAEIEKK